MMRFSLCIVLGSILLFGAAGESDACSTFCFQSQGGPIFGKNYDWAVDDGFLVVNKRGAEKVAMTEDNPARWTARYGSVTFNQYGREFPCGGMNEEGLVVELMWFDGTRYPEPDDRRGVTTLQWIQYQLDNCASVGEVLASDNDIRITSRATASIHFLIADAAGECAAVEFIKGRLVVHTGGALPLRALTNDAYSRCIEYSRRFAGTAALPRSSRSLDRFVRAAHMSAGFVGDTGTAVQHAFGVLSNVAQGENTRWSIVYDIAGRRVNFKTHAHSAARFVDFDALDFSCDTPVMIVDLNAPLDGDIAPRLVPYTRDANLALIVTAFGETDFLRDVPRATLESVARYPDFNSCPAQAE
jgi:choloylglycine hydrolase